MPPHTHTHTHTHTHKHTHKEKKKGKCFTLKTPWWDASAGKKIYTGDICSADRLPGGIFTQRSFLRIVSDHERGSRQRLSRGRCRSSAERSQARMAGQRRPSLHGRDGLHRVPQGGPERGVVSQDRFPLRLRRLLCGAGKRLAVPLPVLPQRWR